MEDNTVIALRQPGDITDPLTEALRNGARALLAQAVEAEVAEALAAHAHLITEDGHRRLVRHGHMPERTIQTGIGPVPVRQPRVRDRGGAEGERIRFSSTLLPRYARRTRSLDALLPVLYLRGISTGDMQQALAALLGKDAPNLSPAVLTRLKTSWQEEFERWKRRDLSARRYVYIWADGVYLQARKGIREQWLV
jgi:transposase-like protein